MAIKELVKIESGTVYIDSRDYCRDVICVDHGDWMSNVLKKHQETIERYFNHIRFENGNGIIRPQGGGKQEIYALLTEPQCNFALTLSRNTPETMIAKAELIADFERAKALLKSQFEAQFHKKPVAVTMDKLACDRGGCTNLKIRYGLAPDDFSEDSITIFWMSGIASQAYFNRACRDDLIEGVDYIEGDVRGELILTPRAAIKMLITLRSRRGVSTQFIPEELKDLIGNDERKINRRKPQKH